MEKSKKNDEITNSDIKEQTLLCKKIKLESSEIDLWNSNNRNSFEAPLEPQNIKTENVFDVFFEQQGFLRELNDSHTGDTKQVKIKCENTESGSFFESKYLKTEIDFKHEEYCVKEEEDESVTYEGEEEEKKESNANLQQPPILPFTTASRKSFKKVMRTHDQSQPYNCPHCDRTFNRKNGLDNHVLKYHADDVETLKTISNKIHECGRCKYKTVIKTHMNSHVVAKHGDSEGAKTYKCDWCNYDTHLKSNLRQHMRTHSFLKTYVCAACTRAFNQKLQLDSHIFTQHKTDTELQKTITNKIHDCPHCDYRSVISSHVKSHVKVTHGNV